MTFRELFTKHFRDYGYINYIQKYDSLLIEPIEPRNQAAFINAIATDADRESYNLEIVLKDAAQKISLSFRVFRAIIENSDPKVNPNFVVVQKALHELMFKTLYHLDRSCRTLIETQVTLHQHDDLNSYIKSLSKKLSLARNDVATLGQVWFDEIETLYYHLAENQCNMKVFAGDANEVWFQIYNKDVETLIDAEPILCASNGILISKYYFVTRIFNIFHHLSLITQILDVEKNGNMLGGDLEVFELEHGGMDAFNQAAREFLDR